VGSIATAGAPKVGSPGTGVRRGFLGHARRELVGAPTLDHDECDAVDDERRSDDPCVVEVLLHEVIERDANDRRRQAAHDDLAPQAPRVAALLLRLAKAKGQQVAQEENANGENSAKLDHDEEHVPEFLGDVELDELIDQDHVPRRGDRQPLRDALDQTEKRGFKQFDDVQRTSPSFNRTT